MTCKSVVKSLLRAESELFMLAVNVYLLIGSLSATRSFIQQTIIVSFYLCLLDLRKKKRVYYVLNRPTCETFLQLSDCWTNCAKSNFTILVDFIKSISNGFMSLVYAWSVKQTLLLLLLVLLILEKMHSKKVRQDCSIIVDFSW